jgi:mannose-6-phosphate isomerase-like protein (cupin superfamily)
MKTPYVNNIDKDTIGNENFRKVVFTGKHLQLVLMSIPVGEEIGGEVHDSVDQFIRIERGQAKAIIDDQVYEIGDDFAITIPAGSKHNIINTGDEPLKIYSIYAPPEHHDNGVDLVKEVKRISTFSQFINESKKPKVRIEVYKQLGRDDLLTDSLKK